MSPLTTSDLKQCKKAHTVVIGGGPAGLFGALLLAESDVPVILLEKMNQCGRKLLISGSGQCNITHSGDISEFFSRYGDHGSFLRPALRAFTNQDLVRFLTERGVPLREEPGGKVFPASGKARDIQGLLIHDATKAGATILCDESCLSITREGDLFIVMTRDGRYEAETVIIATGGYTYPATGSTGDGYQLARSLGHTLVDPAPALTPMVIRNFPFTELSGISFADVPFSIYRENKKVGDHRGDILITHTGLSGPGILDASRYILPGDTIHLSFLPVADINLEREELTRIITGGKTKFVRTVLAGMGLAERLVRSLMEYADIPLDTTCSQFPKASRTRLTKLILEFPFLVERPGGREEAMVTRGGVSLSGIRSDSMESKLVSGLYCIGEVLDIDGDCGGYNLQAAFSTAALAAASIGKKRMKS